MHLFSKSILIVGLASTTESYEIFLLSSAAIANITFMDSLGCEILAQYEAPRILIKACSTLIANSVFAKDQVKCSCLDEFSNIILVVIYVLNQYSSKYWDLNELFWWTLF